MTREPDAFRVRLDDELDVHASAVVVASGVRYRRLDLPGLADLEGRGVYYAAGQLEATIVAERNASSSEAPTRPDRRRCSWPATPATFMSWSAATTCATRCRTT